MMLNLLNWLEELLEKKVFWLVVLLVLPLQAALQVAKDLTEDDTVRCCFPRFHQILLV